MPFHFWKLPVPNLVSYVAFNSGSNIDVSSREVTTSSPTSKDARRGVNEEWSVPARKRLARVANAHHKFLPLCTVRLYLGGRDPPPRTSVRLPGRGPALDPALSADEMSRILWTTVLGPLVTRLVV
ncbi:hypothetical protein PGTUg99_008626 [Puccinia graminis f. sp. tritici]|uniref:Uncharacterized protein n=1 Tax=Puccinia graminis f. sp. tritici TaxID=56615 RepID=A0A5B0QDT5_PUCGR|nr:hypothetical protein PGTUg99_008626 [Puccinia graminis f. sp. tritici]